MKIPILIITVLLGSMHSLQAQNLVSADSLFKNAREVAFQDHDYSKAKQLSYRALEVSPLYADVEIFLGRIHAWTNQYDSARYYFENVLNTMPGNEEASIAYADLEYWNDHYNESLNICNKALEAHPYSGELLLRKAKNLNATKQYDEANVIISALLKANKHNTEALSLASKLKDVAAMNKLSVNYEHSSFNKQYDQAWQMISVACTRQVKPGSITARINYANRFNINGLQGEIDVYSRINKTFYSYASFGYSSKASVFPKYRAGLSLYANLPHSFEAEAGLRYLYFSNSTVIYTACIGKYYRNFLFSARTYFVPSSHSLSQSYIVAARYYLRGADDYIGINIGSGISPDDNTQNIQFNAKQIKLSSMQASAAFSHTFLKRNIISLGAGIINREYKPDTKSNQINLSVGLSRRF